MDIDDLIRYENENTALDFKAVQYQKKQFEALVKDIMAMANANITGDKYIVVGVKHKSNGEREFLGIDKDAFMDSAVYQQVILENVEPEIPFEYLPYSFRDKLFGVFRVPHCSDPPYMMKKDYRNLKKGDSFIRRGSQQSRLQRRDLDKMIESRIGNVDFEKYVSIYFQGTDGDKEIELSSPGKPVLPSERAKIQIQVHLDEKENMSAQTGHNLLGTLGLNLDPLLQLSYANSSIEDLKKALKSVKNDYLQDDLYELFEQHSHKLNFIVFNASQSYLEDCTIEITLKKQDGLLLADKIHTKPNRGFFDIGSIGVPNMFYPSVNLDDGHWVIRHHIGDIRHQMPTEAFEECLRVVFGNKLRGQSISFKCRLFAKNLPQPILRSLSVTVTESRG